MAKWKDWVGKDVQGSRPAAAAEGKLFYNETTSRLQRDTGAAWEDLTNENLENNLSAADAPDANDDTGSGYAVGSIWVDTTNDRAYICLDASAAAAVWVEITVPQGEFFLSAAGMWPSTTNGCADHAQTEFGTNDVDLMLLAFDKDSDEFAQVTVAMPDDYDGGTVTAEFHWTSGDHDGNDVVWGIQGIALDNDDAIDQAWGGAQTVTDTEIAANDYHITSQTAAITLAGTPAAGQGVQFRVYRDADAGGDNHGYDALLIGVKIRYTRTTS